MLGPKIYLSCMAMVFALLPELLFAQNTTDSKHVTVTAQGCAPVSQGEIQAKQVALMLAKRQAVEKAAGMSMDVSNTPDQRTIIEKAMAGMSYSTVSEQTSKGMYTIVIQAVVDVPASEPAQTTGLSVSSSASGDLIEKNPYGEINWTNGTIIAYGKAVITMGLDKDICNSMARRAAILDAHARVLEMIQRINLDGDTTVHGFVSKNSRLFYRLKGLLARVEPFEEHADNGFYNVKIEVPFYGVRGVQAIFLNAYIKSGIRKAQEQASGARVVINAKGTGLKPALFVNIKDQSGKTVYTAKDVGTAVLKNNGMAHYVTSATLLQDDVQIHAVAASGKQKGNIVISSPDAEKLKQTDKNGSALSNGNVVIISDSPVGGTEGMIELLHSLRYAQVR